MLAIKGLYKSFSKPHSSSVDHSKENSENIFWALQDINLSVNAGEFLTWLGPSGCGKTTLLRCLAGLEVPTQGDIFLDDRSLLELSAQERPFHMVFQRYALFPHLTVEENIGFSLQLKKTDPSKRQHRITELLEMMDLQTFRHHKPAQLSGGQSQRVALARAIADQPRVLLLDEPLSALDEKIRSHVRQELKAWQRRMGITFLFVTHDQQEALQISDRIAVFHQGKLHQVGSPQEIYLNPQTEFVADFIGSKNLVTRNATSIQYIYPEKIKIGSHLQIQFQARVVSIDYLGKDSQLNIKPVNSADGLLPWKVILGSEHLVGITPGKILDFSYNPQDLIQVSVK